MGSAPTRPPPREDRKPEPGELRQLSDQALLEGYAARGDQEAFALLVERHGRTVWGVCRRLLHQEQDAEDAFQAVFVVLARKAATIRNREAVGSWLYGVAYRTAMSARHHAGRRQDHERQASEQAQRAGRAPQTEPWGEAACREVQRLLDEEVQRLGTSYRAPFVLCCLEGMSKAEAAKELGWKEGTVSGRLARARKLLQQRLARRGVALSAALTALAVAESTAAPPDALRLAAKGAPQAGTSSPCSVSSTAIQLAETVLRTFKSRGLKVGLVLFLGLLLLLGGATWAGLHFASDTLDPDLFVGPPVALGTPIDEQVLAVAFTPDGQRLVTAGGNALRQGQIQIWDVASKESQTTFRPLPGVRSISFAPDGQTFATADFQGDIRIRDAATGEERAVARAHDGGAACVAFSADGTSLLSAGMDGNVKLWQVLGFAPQRTFLGHGAAVLTAAFFHKAPALVSGGEDNTVVVWDSNSGKAKLTLRGHHQVVESVAVSPDDKLLASASRDGTVRLWNSDTGAEQAVLDHDGVAVHAVAFSRDGEQLGTAAEDGKVRLWNVKPQKLIGAVGTHKAAARTVAFSPDGTLLASGSSDKTAKLWPLRAGNKPATLETESELVQPILALAYSPDGQLVAMATSRSEVQIRDASSGDVVRVLRGHTAAVNCLAFSDSGHMLASGSDDYTVRLWDMDTAQEIFTLNQDGEVYALTFTRDGKNLASGGSDGVLRLWDVTSGKESKTFPAFTAAVHAVAAGPDQRIITGLADGTVGIWDLNGAPEAVLLKAHSGAIRALALSARGILASAGEDHLVKLWEPALDRECAILTGHEDAVTALAFTPSGRTLVSGGHDQTMRVWDGATGELRATLRGHKKPITTVAIHPHGKNLVSGGLDTMALRWRGTTKSAGQAAASMPIVMADRLPERAVKATPPAAAGPVIVGAEPKQRNWLPLILAGSLAATLLVSWIYMLRRTAVSRLANGTPRSDSDPSAGSPAMPKLPSSGIRRLSRRYVWLIAVGLVAVVAITTIALGVVQSGGAESESEFYQDFRGKPLPAELTLFNVQDEKMLQVESEGVRIKIPKDWIHPWGGVGFLTAFGLKGDFDVTVTLEILRADRPGPGAGWGSGVTLQVRRETGGGASVARVLLENAGEVILCDHIDLEGRGRWYPSPCTDKVGRLRFKRTGGTLFCQWAPGTAGDNFEDRQVLDFGSDNIQDIRLAATNGRTNAEVDVRLLDLRVRSRIARSTSFSIPGGKLAAALLFGLILAVGLFVAARPRRRRTACTGPTTGSTMPLANSRSDSDPTGGSGAMKVTHNRLSRLSRPYVWLVAIGLIVVVGITAIASGLSQEGAAESEAKFYQDFRGKPLPAELEFFHVQGQKMLQVEPEGVHIKIPKDFIHLWGGVGLVTAFGLKGDFEVTTTVQILYVDQPPPGAGCGAGVCLHVHKVGGGGASVHRVLLTNGSPVILCDHTDSEGQGPRYPSPCTDTVGRLRIKRKGGTLSYQWAPGTEGDNFQERQAVDFGTTDIECIRLAAVNGRSKTEVDVRLLDLRVRSDISQSGSLSIPGGKLVAALVFVLILVAGLFVAARPRRGRQDQIAEAVLDEQSPLDVKQQVARRAPDTAPLSAIGAPYRGRRRLHLVILTVAAAGLLGGLLWMVLNLAGLWPTAKEDSANLTDVFSYDFRGRPVPPEFALYGDLEGRFLRQEPGGLRITLPPTYIHPWGGVGLLSKIGLCGDFDVTSTWEILHTDVPPSGGIGVGASMRVHKGDEHSEAAATLARVIHVGGREAVFWDLAQEEPADSGLPRAGGTPCQEKLVRLRLKRVGSTLHYLWAPGPEGQDFDEVHSTPFVIDDIRSVRFSVTTSRTPCNVDVRLLNVQFRNSGKLSAQSSKPRPFTWLAVAILLLFVFLCVGARLWGRQRGVSV